MRRDARTVLCLWCVLCGMLMAGCTASTTSGPELIRKLSGHGAWVNSVAWSPDSKQLASASSDRTVRVWDTTSGQTVKRISEFKGGVNHVAWSPDGRWLAAAEHADVMDVKIFETKPWQLVAGIRSNQGLPYDTYVRGLAWSPDSQYLAVGASGVSGSNTPVSSWANTYETQKWRRVDSLENKGGVDGAVWSPDGKSIGFGTVNRPAQGLERLFVIWQPGSSDITKLTDGVRSAGTGVAWSPDSRYLAGASGVEDIPIWDVATEQKNITLSGHTGSIKSLSWSPLGEQLASGSVDLTARIWDTSTGKNLKTFEHGDIVSSVAWSPDGNTLATGCADYNVYLWDVR